MPFTPLQRNVLQKKGTSSSFVVLLVCRFVKRENFCFAFFFAGKHFRGEQRGRWGRGGGRKRRSFDKPQTKKESDGNEDETKATHTRFDDEEPTPKKIKTEDDS